jgi:uncharacterized protein (DUF1330 family)
MPGAYVIVDTAIHDAEAYEPYKAAARPIVEKHGGRYIVRGGAMEALETDLWAPSRLVVIRFPDLAAARAFIDDPDYAPWRERRRAAARCSLTLVEGFEDDDLTA